MHKRDWSKIGQVKTRDCHGREYDWDTLEDAISYYRYSIKDLGGYPVATSSNLFREYSFLKLDFVAFYDEMGMRIPLWKIKEVYATLSFPSRGWRRADPEVYGPKGTKFRKGTIPGIHAAKWHKGTYYKRFSFISTFRDNAYLDSDDEMRDYGITSRRTNFPNPWEDFPRSYHKNWKKYRKTQWKS